jgi:penicillin V acylase-like amidase (Ntn superfamily)
VDHNSGSFNHLKVSAPDSGNALAGVPSSQISSGRFVKAAFYSNYVRKAKTPKEAIQTLAHVMNNFDRPYDLSIDPPGSASPGESSDPSKTVTEVTYFTVLNDLGQNHFYIRGINAINYTKIDIGKLAGLKTSKVVSMAAIDELNGGDATELFLKGRPQA